MSVLFLCVECELMHWPNGSLMTTNKGNSLCLCIRCAPVAFVLSECALVAQGGIVFLTSAPQGSCNCQDELEVVDEGSGRWQRSQQEHQFDTSVAFSLWGKVLSDMTSVSDNGAPIQEELSHGKGIGIFIIT